MAVMKVHLLALAMITAGCAHAPVQNEHRAVDRKAEQKKSPVELAWDRAFLSRDAAVYAEATALHETARDPESQNRYGKLLYAQGQWRQAAETFDTVADSSRGYIAQAAARNAILAWRKVLDEGEVTEDWFHPLRDDETVDLAPLSFYWDRVEFETLDRGNYRQEDLPLAEQKLASAADRYVAIADPMDDALPLIQAISANFYFRRAHFDETADRCLRIVDRWPRHDLARTCGNVILNIMSATADWKALEGYARQLHANRAVLKKNPELYDAVEETLYGAAFQNVFAALQAAQKQRNRRKKKALLLEAARRFRAYQDEFPNSPYADKALYNALAQYVNLGVPHEARQVAATIVEDYPDSPVAPEAERVLAQLSR